MQAGAPKSLDRIAMLKYRNRMTSCQINPPFYRNRLKAKKLIDSKVVEQPVQMDAGCSQRQ